MWIAEGDCDEAGDLIRLFIVRFFEEDVDQVVQRVLHSVR